MSFLTKALEAARTGLALLEQLRPVVEAVGGPLAGRAIGVAALVSEILRNIQQRVDEGKIVLSSSDEAEIKRITAQIAVENDTLAAYIEADTD